MLDLNTKTRIRKLTQKKHRAIFKQCLVEGKKGVQEALMHAHVDVLIVEEGLADPDISALQKRAHAQGVTIAYAGKKDISYIKQTETFPGVLAIVRIPDQEQQTLLNAKTILFLDEINDPGNLGTIIRTADWFGVHDIILSQGSVDPYNEKVVRSTMGSLFRSRLYCDVEIPHMVDFLKKHGYSITICDLSGDDMRTAAPVGKQVLIFGSESHGISNALRAQGDRSYRIEGSGGAESLNVAMSVGIALYQLSQ